MSWSVPLVARGASALVLSVALGGCVFLTPPSGICVTDTCKKFETDRVEAAAAAAKAAADQANATPAPPQVYDTTDFKLTYLGAWGPLASTSRDESGQEVSKPIVDATDPEGTSTLRIAVGRPVDLGNGVTTSEGMRIITLNRGFDGEPTAAMAALLDVSRRSMLPNFDGQPEIVEGDTTLAGKPAKQISMVGTAKGQGPVMRHIARVLIHRGRAYILLLSTAEAAYKTLSASYDKLFEGFELKDADPTYPLPSPAPSSSPTPGTGSPAPTGSGSPSPGQTQAPTVSPSPTGSPSPSPSPKP